MGSKEDGGKEGSKEGKENKRELDVQPSDQGGRDIES